jgi:L-alanine-DL-glutamate epimerase-like enolase superfamily enzyme
MADIEFDRAAKIERIEWARIPGKRPRPAGKNARLEAHGVNVNPPIARIVAGGASGFGWSVVSPEHAQKLIGRTIGEMFDPLPVVKREFRAIEIPLLDWLGRATKKPVYEIVGNVPAPLAVPCYDTSLYFDDLHIDDHKAAADFMAAEAAEGLARGHRAFKIKVGRGALHMPLAEGMTRDAAIVHAVRNQAGPDASLLVDANNGFNFNLTTQFLTETADAKLLFIEEPFHEDGELYRRLREWLNKKEMKTLIADGEGDYSRHLLDWALSDRVDVLQYDIFQPGFSHWLELAPTLHGHGIKAAPHHYGNMVGNHVSCHLAAALDGFLFAEWDEAQAAGIDTTAWAIKDGKVLVPDRPGFGLEFDEKAYAKRVAEEGFAVS